MEAPPPFKGYEVVPDEELEWLGKAHALLKRWDSNEAYGFQLAVDSLGIPLTAQQNINKLKAIIYRAIADLEERIRAEAPSGGGAFGPGAVYDFFKALNELVQKAQSSLFIADPYMDEDIFDHYLSSSSVSVDKRLLVKKNSANLSTAGQMFVQQHGGNLEIRKSSNFHDRIIIVDASSCWVLGQSIKDAANNGPTYLAPLSADVATLKIPVYEALWQQATVI